MSNYLVDYTAGEEGLLLDGAQSNDMPFGVAAPQLLPDDVNSRITLTPIPAVLQGTGDFSINFFFRLNDILSWRYATLASIYDGVYANSKFLIRYHQTTRSIYTYLYGTAGSGAFVSAATSHQGMRGAWVNYGLTVDNDTAYIYIDGVLDQTLDLTAILPISAGAGGILQFGNYAAAGAVHSAYCQMQGFRFYIDRALSASEQRQLGRHEDLDDETDLAGHWPVNDGAGVTVADIVNGNDATFDSSPVWVPDDGSGTGIIKPVHFHHPGCLEFDGSNTIVEMSGIVPTSYNGQVMIHQMSIKPTLTGEDYQILFEKTGSATAAYRGYALMLMLDGSLHLYANGAYEGATGAGAIRPGLWQTVTCYAWPSGMRQQIYVDGRLVFGSELIAIFDVNYAYPITYGGGRYRPTSNHFNGLMREVTYQRYEHVYGGYFRNYALNGMVQHDDDQFIHLRMDDTSGNAVNYGDYTALNGTVTSGTWTTDDTPRRCTWSAMTGDLLAGEGGTVQTATPSIAKKPSGSALFLQSSPDGDDWYNGRGDDLLQLGHVTMSNGDAIQLTATSTDTQFDAGTTDWSCVIRIYNSPHTATTSADRRLLVDYPSSSRSYTIQRLAIMTDLYGRIRAYFSSGAAYRFVETSNAIVSHGWSHLVVTWDATTKTISVYLNGVECLYNIATGSGTPGYVGYTGSAHWYLSEVIDRTGNHVSDLRIYPATKLSAEDVSNLYLRNHDANSGSSYRWRWGANGFLDDTGTYGTNVGAYNQDLYAKHQEQPLGEPLGNLNCVRLDGSGDSMTITDAATIQDIFSGGGSVSWHHRLDSPSGPGASSGELFDKGSWTVDFDSYDIYYGAYLRITSQRTGTDGVWTTASRLLLFQWTYCVLEWDTDGTDAPILTVDGREIELTVTTPPVGDHISDVGSDFQIGGTVTNYRFGGYLGNLAFWSATRTDEEKEAAWENGFEDTDHADIISYLEMGEGSDEPQDSVGSNHVTTFDATWGEDAYRPYAGNGSVDLTGVSIAGSYYAKVVGNQSSPNQPPAELSGLTIADDQLEVAGADGPFITNLFQRSFSPGAFR